MQQGDGVRRGIAAAQNDLGPPRLIDHIAQRGGICTVARPQDCDLDGPLQKEIQRAHHVAKPRGRLPDLPAEKMQHALGHRPPVRTLEQCTQPHQGKRACGIARRRGIVKGIFRPHNQALVILPGIKKAAIGIIPKLIDHHRHQIPRRREMGRVKTRFVQIDQPHDQTGVIVQIGIEPRPTIAIRVQQQALIGPHVIEDKPRCIRRMRQIRRLPKRPIRLPKRGNHQPIPTRLNFLIAVGLHAPFPRFKQHRPPSRHRGFIHLFVYRDIRDILPLEIAPRRNIAIATKRRAILLAQQRDHLLRLPHEKLALFPLAIRVLRGVKPALGRGHLPHCVLANGSGDAREQRVLRHQIGLRVQPCEQGVVVQHLFKMRHEPAGIHGIPVKPPAELIENPSPCHLLQSQRHHL